MVVPFHEKINIVKSALRIDPDQLKHAAQANLDIHFSPPVDFLFLESLPYTSIPRETECVGPDKPARSAPILLVRYITHTAIVHVMLCYIIQAKVVRDINIFIRNIDRGLNFKR